MWLSWKMILFSNLSISAHKICSFIWAGFFSNIFQCIYMYIVCTLYVHVHVCEALNWCHIAILLAVLKLIQDLIQVNYCKMVKSAIIIIFHTWIIYMYIRTFYRPYLGWIASTPSVYHFHLSITVMTSQVGHVTHTQKPHPPSSSSAKCMRGKRPPCQKE